jgi:hypothetical protein
MSSFTMNYKHKHTLAAFTSRASKLSRQDIWYPLVIDPQYTAEHPVVLKLWDAISLSTADFTGIVESNDGYWINCGERSSS